MLCQYSNQSEEHLGEIHLLLLKFIGPPDQLQKNFEYILNIREELIQICNNVVKNLDEANIISNSTEFRDLIGTNLRHLRKIANVESCGYYKDLNYVNRMLELIRNKTNWNIHLVGDKIQVNKENMADVFSVLTNSRLKSEINQEEFDADTKCPLKGK